MAAAPKSSTLHSRQGEEERGEGVLAAIREKLEMEKWRQICKIFLLWIGEVVKKRIIFF